MKGKIIIEAGDTPRFSIMMKMSDVSKLDQLLIFDALTEAFELTEEDKTILGWAISAGGVRKVFGDAVDTIKANIDLIEKLKREFEQS